MIRRRAWIIISLSSKVWGGIESFGRPLGRLSRAYTATHGKLNGNRYFTGEKKKWIPNGKLSHQVLNNHRPVSISLRTRGKILRSTMDVMTPSSVPNWESIPRVSSIKKNRTDHRGANGNWLTASVQMMKAKPVPDAVWIHRQTNKAPNEWQMSKSQNWTQWAEWTWVSIWLIIAYIVELLLEIADG